MKLKKFAYLLTAAVVSVSIVGCSGSNENSKKETNKGDNNKSITLMMPEDQAPSRDLLSLFEKESGYKVNLVKSSFKDIDNSLIKSASNQKAEADVVAVRWDQVGQYRSRGYLEILKPKDQVLNDIKSTNYFAFGKNILGIPYTNKISGLFADSKILEDENLDTKNNNLEQILKKLKKDKIEYYPLSISLDRSDESNQALYTIIMARDGKIFDADKNLFIGHNLHTSLVFIENLISNGFVAQASDNESNLLSDFKNKKSSLYIGSIGTIKDLNGVEMLDMLGESGPSKKTLVYPNALYISAFSKKKDIANKFIEWYTSKNIQSIVSKDTGLLPASNDALSKTLTDSKVKNSVLILSQMEKLDRPFPNSTPKYYDQFSRKMYPIINELGKGLIGGHDAHMKIENDVEAIIKHNQACCAE